MVDRASILKQVQELTPEERLALIDELWLSATNEIVDRPLGTAEREFLDARVRDAALHVEDERDWEQLYAELGPRP